MHIHILMAHYWLELTSQCSCHELFLGSFFHDFKTQSTIKVNVGIILADVIQWFGLSRIYRNLNDHFILVIALFWYRFLSMEGRGERGHYHQQQEPDFLNIVADDTYRSNCWQQTFLVSCPKLQNHPRLFLPSYPTSVCVCVYVCVCVSVCVHARLVAQLCLTLYDPIDCSPPGSTVQARILEWVTMSSSRGSSQPRDKT